MLRLVLALSLTTLAACGSTPAAPEHAVEGHRAVAQSQPTTQPADIKPNDGTRTPGDITRCAVTGDVFTVKADSPSAQHAGGTYYFCCKGCIKDFVAAPEKYTGG